ncbi:dynamin family protein [Clostridium taeniosporum]|uniref:Dynamin family protein n=1 Tax=Clostridium taeniosporum TaxID=394958 RepID=A0A1D7XJF2_9CLOT|nr:dynamin family protein [Clostridium taeniosporum]AOR23463.1 dynamin family protein [Clostridium taeniosporum]
MNKNNYILQTIEDIKNVLEQNEYRKNRYNNDIEWLQQRKKQIKSNIIRIAIMGITSSGKSTLVNSLLGEKLLPVAILPSSSIIITVSKGEKRQATIYFKDKSPEVYEDTNLNIQVISKYADENKNPNNKFNVSQIDIKSPNFLFDDSIQLIDSPGLEAYNLEMHEKLTLEILLPTIDICVFLTTVKANSDAINLEKIKIVNDKRKQIVLVQNMIDSVEEKIGKYGIVEESRDVILDKHKKRAQALLEKATNNRKFDVIQISSLNALNGRIKDNNNLYKESNIEEFINSVYNCIENIIPKLNFQRQISIIERIDNIIDTDKEIIDGSDLEDTSYIKEILNDIDDLNYDFRVSRDKITSKINLIDKITVNTIEEINESDSKEISSYLDIVENINNKSKKIENQILSIVRECEEKKKEIYEKLNIDIRFSYSLPSMENEDICVKHKYEEKVKLIKKEGFFNKGKRILSDIFEADWGYEKQEYDEKVVDKEGTILIVKKVCNESSRKYMSILYDWSEQYSNSLSFFYSEISKIEEEFKKKKEQNIELYDIDTVIRDLNIMRNKLKNKCKHIEEIAVTSDAEKKKENTFIKLDEIEVTTVSYNLYKLSNEIFKKNYSMINNYIEEKVSFKSKKEVHKIFWTWDLDAATNFIFRMYDLYLSKDELEIIEKQGIYTFKNITIVYELSRNKFNVNQELNINNTKEYNIYLLFNGIQIGSSEKQIIENFNLKNVVLKHDMMINLVIDSSREFINANNIKEILIATNSLKKKILSIISNSKIGYILVNSKNPIYNIALIEGQENNGFLLSEYKDIKTKLFENILSRGNEEKQTLEEILSYFLK